MMGAIGRSSATAAPGSSESAHSGDALLHDADERHVASPTHLRGSMRSMAGPQSLFGLAGDGRQGGLVPSDRPAVYDEGTLEYLSAEMSFSALYIHDIHRFRLTHGQHEPLTEEDRERAIWQVDTSGLPLPPSSFLPMSNIQEEDDATSAAAAAGGVETDYLLRMEAGRSPHV